MQEWHGVGKITSERIEPGTRQNKKPRNDEKKKEKACGMQQWHKRLRPKTARTKKNENKGHVRQTATILKKREDNQRDLQEGHRARDRETSRRNL
jgi:hypothetical protein